jgi:hypothetical protein
MKEEAQRSKYAGQIVHVSGAAVKTFSLIQKAKIKIST